MWELFVCNEEIFIITKNVTKSFIWTLLQHNNRCKHIKPWVRPGFAYTTILCVVYVFFTVPKQNHDFVYDDCPVKNAPLGVVLTDDLSCARDVEHTKSAFFYTVQLYISQI